MWCVRLVLPLLGFFRGLIVSVFYLLLRLLGLYELVAIFILLENQVWIHVAINIARNPIHDKNRQVHVPRNVSLCDSVVFLKLLIVPHILWFQHERSLPEVLDQFFGALTDAEDILGHVDPELALEKYKNLVMWVDKRQTQIISVVLVIAFVIVTFLPLRFFIMIGYIYKFYKGMKWQAKRQTNNMEICKIELVNFLHDNNINFDDVDRKKRKKNR